MEGPRLQQPLLWVPVLGVPQPGSFPCKRETVVRWRRGALPAVPGQPPALAAASGRFNRVAGVTSCQCIPDLGNTDRLSLRGLLFPPRCDYQADCTGRSACQEAAGNAGQHLPPETRGG